MDEPRRSSLTSPSGPEVQKGASGSLLFSANMVTSSEDQTAEGGASLP